MLYPKWLELALGMALLYGFWSVHAIGAIFLSLPLVYFGRRRVEWSVCDFCWLVLPFCVWLGLMYSGLAEKSYINYIEEALYLTLAIPIATALRLIVGNPRP